MIQFFGNNILLPSLENGVLNFATVSHFRCFDRSGFECARAGDSERRDAFSFVHFLNRQFTHLDFFDPSKAIEGGFARWLCPTIWAYEDSINLGAYSMSNTHRDGMIKCNVCLLKAIGYKTQWKSWFSPMFTDFVKDLGIGKVGFVVGSFIRCILMCFKTLSFLCIVHCTMSTFCIMHCRLSTRDGHCSLWNTGRCE